MGDCLLTKWVVAYFAIVSLSLSSLLAQEVPKSDDESVDIEPPLLVKPWEQQGALDDSSEDATADTLVPQLARRYPRDFTFYVGDPISSIRSERFLRLFPENSFFSVRRFVALL